MFAEVYKKGGSEFLRKSTYFQGAEFLRSTPTSMGGYIEAISNAYDDVYDEMFAAMLEAEEQGQTLTTEETSADETTTLKEDRSPFSEGDGVDFDNLGEFTAKGVNLNSTKPKAKSTGPKPPKSIEGEEVSPTPPNLNTEEVPAVEIPVGQQRVLITYPEVTTENLQRLYPELSEKQINVVANNLRQVFKGKFPDVDF